MVPFGKYHSRRNGQNTRIRNECQVKGNVIVSETTTETNPPQPDPNVTPPTNPPAPQTTPQPQPQAPAEPSSHGDVMNSREVLAAVNSLPERIVNAMREAMTPPTQPAAQPETPKETAKENNATPAKHKYSTFGDWWYGIKR